MELQQYIRKPHTLINNEPSVTQRGPERQTDKANPHKQAFMLMTEASKKKLQKREGRLQKRRKEYVKQRITKSNVSIKLTLTGL